MCALRRYYTTSPLTYGTLFILLLQEACDLLAGYEHCTLCPRRCGTDRTRTAGPCGGTDQLRLARAALHFWEEPCISGEGPNAPGSGTVFFSGCPLRCCFCQNFEISEENRGKAVSEQRLAEIFLELQARGAANINLVTGTHYLPGILRALALARPALTLPVAWNCGGYETLESVEALAGEGGVGIFMPDLKYQDPALSARFSRAPDYFEAASRAVRRMVEVAGPPVYDARGLLRSGVIVRHLVLPGHRDDSLRLLRWLAGALPRDSFILSLMSQYTPYRPLPYKELNRRLSTFEYDAVVKEALRLGFTRAYTQQRTAAKEEYTPPFDLTGL
ncbi:radical SAM protein [Anaerofilum sp. BX8]|uniref:Radical SAM protein n=1 Tax=Anaerofilum hominis TaxID=2763016 RepID=A0A923IFL7_9FIRM|nr:radical SAM protein [Anaerofilum hominis]